MEELNKIKTSINNIIELVEMERSLVYINLSAYSDKIDTEQLIDGVTKSSNFNLEEKNGKIVHFSYKSKEMEKCYDWLIMSNSWMDWVYRTLRVFDIPTPSNKLESTFLSEWNLKTDVEKIKWLKTEIGKTVSYMSELINGWSEDYKDAKSQLKICLYHAHFQLEYELKRIENK